MIPNPGGAIYKEEIIPPCVPYPRIIVTPPFAFAKDGPPGVRRANFLIEGVDLAATIGQVISIGPVQIRIHGETKPCGIMESQQAGLRDALKPNLRGGVHGEVLTRGTIRVGDPVRFAESM